MGNELKLRSAESWEAAHMTNSNSFENVAEITGKIVALIEQLNQLMRLSIVYSLTKDTSNLQIAFGLKSILNELTIDQMRRQYKSVIGHELNNLSPELFKYFDLLDLKIRTCIEIRNIIAHSCWDLITSESLLSNDPMIHLQRLGRSSLAQGMMESRNVKFKNYQESLSYITDTKSIIIEFAYLFRDGEPRLAIHQNELLVVLKNFLPWLKDKTKPLLVTIFELNSGEQYGL